MAKSLPEYYSTNYSHCEQKYSFLASWQGLALISHVVQGITLPFHFLTFHIIIRKTPAIMKNVKWPLLLNHICCTWLDFSICTLVIPYFIVNSIGGFGVGLLNWLGVPVLVQVTVAVLTVFLMSASYTYLFESRSSAIQHNRFRITKTRTRAIYFAINFLLNCSLFLMYAFLPDDQEFARLQSLRTNPCPTKEFFEFDTFIAMIDDGFSILVAIFLVCFLLLNTQVNVFFHAFICVYYLFIVPSTTTSLLTRKIQQNFFIGIVLQTLTFSCLAGLPFLVFVIIFFTKCSCQGITNMGFIVIGLHGLGAAITVLTVHKPYRRAVSEIFRSFRAKKRATFQVQTSHITPNNFAGE